MWSASRQDMRCVCISWYSWICWSAAVPLPSTHWTGVSARIGAVKVRFEASTAKDVLALPVASDAYWSMCAVVVPIEANAAFVAATPERTEFL